MSFKFRFSLFPTILLSASLFLRPALSQNTSSCNALPLRGEVLFQFNQSDQWIENVATRRNGDLLLTLAGPKAQVYLMKNPNRPNTDGKPNVTLLQDFSGMITSRANASAAANGTSVLLGIAEPRPDVFITAGGLLTNQRDSVPGTWGVFELAFQNQTDSLATRKVADLTGAEFPNGVVAVAGTGTGGAGTTMGANFSSVVLIGDSTRGLVYRVDILNGSVETAMQVDEMAARKDGQPPFGINGMKMRGDTLYFDNSNDRAFYSVRLGEGAKGVAQGAAVQKVGAADKVAIFLDDFDVEPDGTIWATGSFGNTLLAVDPATKEAVVVAGRNTSLDVGGPTAAILGRNGTGVLYVVTAGAQGDPVNATRTDPGKVEPGKVLRFNISGFAACKAGRKSVDNGGGGMSMVQGMRFLVRRWIG